MNEVLDSMACKNTLDSLEFFAKNGDFDSLVKLAEFLKENGYDSDRFVHQMLAKGYYASGMKTESAKMFEKAITSEHTCDFIQPFSEIGQLMDMAITHYQLSEVYKELGIENRAIKEYETAIDFSKKAFKEKYSEKVVKKVFEQNSLTKITK
ncbi:MAG: hypothetical protein GY699_20850 [Desulfobacteraceae bacterium]|nr:hypothetical protein [Desulfobacteraceae bacterium]